MRTRLNLPVLGRFLRSSRFSTARSIEKVLSTLQGGTLCIDFAARPINLEIIPLWQEEVNVSLNNSDSGKVEISHDISNNIVYLSEVSNLSKSPDDGVICLKLSIPELFNVRINADNLTLNLANKVIQSQ